MTTKTDLDRLDVAHRVDVTNLAARGGFKKLSNAADYVEKTLAPLWRPLLDLDSGKPLVNQLRLTPTMTLILHLFGRAVHRRGRATSTTPFIQHWRPVYDKHAEHVRFPCAISKADIAKIIGKGRHTVDEAIGNFRGKSERYGVLYAKRVAYPLWVETGIVFDLMVEPNLSFAFMLDDYTYAGKVALNARLNDAFTIHRQLEWCNEAARKQSPLQSVPRAPENDTRTSHEERAEAAA